MFLKTKHKVRLVLMLYLLTFCPFAIKAQDDEVMARLQAGHNAAFGGFAALSLESVMSFCEKMSVCGGVQYNTIGKTAVEIRPAYHVNLDWGKLSAEALATYTNLTQVNCLSVGAGACVDSKSISGRLGYYYRLFGGGGSTITEPFNIYYELRAHFLKKLENWNLDLVITNCEIFELERHFQPSFIAEGWYYPKSNVGITLGIGCKPAGMFNMSADYYQSYLKTGVCYRW